MSELLSVRDLKVGFALPEGRLEAVRGVSFRVRPGSTVALVGESGSGKSVCAQSILGILPSIAKIDAGQILFDDPSSDGPPIDIAQLDRNGRAMRQLRGDRISMVFQEPMTSLSPVHTVGNQVREALELHRKVTPQESEELTVDMLRLVGFPDPVQAERTYPFELSGGLRQRAVIAMALICRPALLIADEPTTALDVTIQAQILKLIADLQEELGMAVLIITHDLGVVANVAEEVVVMYHGEVMERGTLDDIFRAPEHPYLKALLKAVPRFDLEPGERLTPIREIKHDPASSAFAPKGVPGTAGDPAKLPPLLTVSHVTKQFAIRKKGWFGSKTAGGVLAVDDVSLEVRRGECLGLVGESGCGKTTLSKMIMRALTPDEGEITWNDGSGPLDMLTLKGDALKQFRKRIQFIFQDPFSSLNPRMTALDIVAEPMVIHDIGDDASRDETVKELMRIVGLNVRHLRRYPHSFSGGQRQRLGIARALTLQPEMLICDEPVSALDVSIQAQILNLLNDLRKELGLTYIFISHNLAVVDYVADRIAVMCRGRIVEVAPREMLFRRPIHPYTKALVSAVPEPDPERPLDLAALMEGKASNPAAWPQPFTLDGTTKVSMIDFGEGHLVRARAEARPLDLAS